MAAADNLTALTYPVLIADIGGTNARFAMMSNSHAQMRSFDVAEVSNYPGLFEAIDDCVLSRISTYPRSLVLAIAAPIAGQTIPMTNSDWVIDPRQLIDRIGLEDVILFNDFEALALALWSLDSEDLDQIGGDRPVADAAKLVLGPGTGLGAATLVHAMHTWIPVPGEGGHVELGPVEPEEFDLWPHIDRLAGRVSAEHLISGPGLVRLYQAVARSKGMDPHLDAPSMITEAAKADDQVAVQTMRLFSRFLGRVAGDLALVVMARGGVYIAGGIAPFLHSREFRDGFENKAPHTAILEQIPTYVIRHQRPALQGLAAFARTPQRFGVDLTGRRWS